MKLYPLRFRPLFRQYIWGGRRLGETLNKPIGPGDSYAESWEVVDRGEDQSIVVGGPLAGKTLGELVRTRRADLLGRGTGHAEFPLLLKYLDCNRDLSIQVHPDDAFAAQLDPPDRGKTEAWYIIDAQPGSRLWAGLKPEVDRPALEAAIREDRIEDCLHEIEPQSGDCVFIPAGTVHALGAGMLVAEIQQSSDTTFRLYDWGRVDSSGKPRPLHIEQALQVIDFARGPVELQKPQGNEEGALQRLVGCDKFVLSRVAGAADVPIGGDGLFHILAVVCGKAALTSGDWEAEHLELGETLLVPASCGAGRLQLPPGAEVLEAHLPE